MIRSVSLQKLAQDVPIQLLCHSAGHAIQDMPAGNKQLHNNTKTVYMLPLCYTFIED